jgi:hypothetical protein
MGLLGLTGKVKTRFGKLSGGREPARAVLENASGRLHGRRKGREDAGGY